MADENNFATTPSSTAPAVSGQIGSATPEQLGDLKRPENWVNKFELDTSMNKDPNDTSKATWVTLGQGITSITPSASDTATKDSYWSDKGWQSTTITGKNITFAVKGDRVVGDPAQDFIAGLQFKMGDDVRTLMRWTDQSDNVIIASITIQKVQTMGGNANAQQTFSFEMDINGQPVLLSTKGQNNDDGTGIGGAK